MFIGQTLPRVSVRLLFYFQCITHKGNRCILHRVKSRKLNITPLESFFFLLLNRKSKGGNETHNGSMNNALLTHYPIQELLKLPKLNLLITHSSSIALLSSYMYQTYTTQHAICNHTQGRNHLITYLASTLHPESSMMDTPPHLYAPVN